MNNVTRIGQIVNWFTGVTAIAVIILTPLVFVSLEFRYLKGNLDSEVQINSRIISDHINANPEMWRFEKLRLVEILSQRPKNGAGEIRRIIDNRNTVVAESADAIFSPFIKTAIDLKDSGHSVGKIEIYRSWRPLLWHAFYFFLFGLLLAAMIFCATRILPFRTLIRAEEALQKSEEMYRTIFEQAFIGVAEVETKTGRILRINQKYCDIIGYSPAEMTGATYMEFTHPEDLATDLDKVREIGEGKIRFYSREKRYIRKDRSAIWVNLTVSPIRHTGKRSGTHIAIVEDITERKLVEKERDRLILKLQQALTKVKTLSGMLPICSYCHKIRDDKGYWNRIEAYIYEHSEAELSHGICPECSEKYFPQKDTGQP